MKFCLGLPLNCTIRDAIINYEKGYDCLIYVSSYKNRAISKLQQLNILIIELELLNLNYIESKSLEC